MDDTPAVAVLDRTGLDALVRLLVTQGRTVVGPTVRDGAVVLAELASDDELPFRWGVELEASHYGCARPTTGQPSRTARGPGRGRRSSTRTEERPLHLLLDPLTRPDHPSHWPTGPRRAPCTAARTS